FFAITTMAVGIPTGIKIFNWLGTMWGGRIQFKTPMLFCIGFLFQFLIAGLTGIMLASAPFDWQLGLSYFVVAHFHYVIVGGILFALFAAFYYWYPKITGRMMSERLGKWHFWLFVLGFHMTFDVMHIPGLLGMPRRIYTYEPGRGWDTMNFIVSIGAFIQGIAILVFVANSLTGPAPRDVLETPIFYTICLLSSSLTIHFAGNFLKRGQQGAFLGLWLLTIVLGDLFMYGTGQEWHRLIYEHGLTISTN